MKKKFYFLSGLPRSGSTLLSAILNQNPKIYCSPTSGLVEIMGTTLSTWYSKINEIQGRDNTELFRLLSGLIYSKYEKIEKPIIIDKSRSWAASQTIKTMSKVLEGDVKIIATVRSVPECAASFIRLTKPKNTEDFLLNSQVINHLKYSYFTLHDGFTKYPDSFIFIDYDDLVNNPKKELDRIHKFLNLDTFEYSFENIESSIVKENDEEVWNIPNLHDIKPRVEKQNFYDCEQILGELYDEFDQEKFWVKTRKKKFNFLERQVELATKGKIDESFDILLELERSRPTNNKILFNKGWFLLNKGKLLEGHKLLNCGRKEQFFGKFPPVTNKPIWDGKSYGTILLVLEGGFGDQIQSLRFAKEIISRGFDVVVSCSTELMALLKFYEEKIFIVNHQNSDGVFHDYWVPGLSAVVSLGMEYEDISGKPYIKKIEKKSNDKLRIGLKWRGNPNYSDDYLRTFPPYLLFDAIKNYDVEFISLQKDFDLESKPEWVSEVNLQTWVDTHREISNCDLVITSCTSIAHLSGAMGIPTWVVVPIFPYYTWCLPGKKTPYYDSVRIFRQKKYGDWSDPFEEINLELKKLIEHKNTHEV